MHVDKRDKVTTMSMLRHLDSGLARIVPAIDKPLGFYVVALLIVEGFLTIILILSDLDKGAKTWGMWIGSGLFVFVVAIVSAIVWAKPTNLTFTGYEALVSMGKVTYGTNTGEVAVEDLPIGIAEPE